VHAAFQVIGAVIIQHADMIHAMSHWVDVVLYYFIIALAGVTIQLFSNCQILKIDETQIKDS
jgi:hypothetical protein